MILFSKAGTYAAAMTVATNKKIAKESSHFSSFVAS